MEEKIIDKNMGSKKISVTKEQFLEEKEKRVKHETIERLQKINNVSKSKLSEKQVNYVNKVLKLYDENKLKDSFLIYYVLRRIEVFEEFELKQNQVKKLQIDLLQKINQVTDEVMSCKNVMDFIDKEISKYIENNLHIINA